MGEQQESRGRLQKTATHTQGDKKQKYIADSTCPGWLHICQETKSEKSPLNPSHHLSHSTSYRISSEEANSAVWAGNPKHARAADRIYACSGIQRYPTALCCIKERLASWCWRLPATVAIKPKRQDSLAFLIKQKPSAGHNEVRAHYSMARTGMVKKSRGGERMVTDLECST